MKIGYAKFEDTEKQTVYFRGYVKVYRGQSVEKIYCKGLGRKSISEALQDAKKLSKKI